LENQKQMIYKFFKYRIPQRHMEISRVKRITGILILIILCSFIPVGCATAPKKPIDIRKEGFEYTRKYISWLIQGQMEKHHVQGLSIALVDDQQVIWAQGFGYADVNKKIRATPETVYPAGSIAKLFTIIAALQLAEQGKINLDQPIQTYLPGFSTKTRFPDAGPITPRSIMTHHSGLPSDRLQRMISRKPKPFTNVLEEIKDEYVAYPPNFIFSYSNLAMRLLGHMVEKVSGRDFVSQMDESVLRPMGMTSASFVPRPEIQPLISKGYKEGKEAEDFLLGDLPSPDGPLYASVIDLSHLIQMVFASGTAGQRRILSPETLSEMLHPQNSNVPLDFDFRIGLGWFLNDVDIKNAGLVASHGGASTLFYSQLIVLPEYDLGVAVLANSSFARGVVDRIAEETLKLALEAKTGIKQPEEKKAPREPIPPWSKLVLKDFEGYYATGPRIYKVSTSGEKLYTRLLGRSVQLVPHGDGMFSVRYRLFGLIPVKLGPLEELKFSLERIAGRAILVLHYQGKKYLLGEKIDPCPISDAWLQRAGDYELVNPDDYLSLIEKVDLRYEDNMFMVGISTPTLGALGTERWGAAICPLSDTEATVLGLGRGMGETIHVVTKSGEERLLYSGCEFRKKLQ
jgi:CubicO group peptidase (beta-lactamase class C family)